MATKTGPSVDQLLDKAKEKFGFVPNVLKSMSVSPALLQAYMQGQAAMQNATLSGQEQQAVQLTVSHRNDCGYCQTAHTVGGKAAGVAEDDLEAIKQGKEPQDEKLANLVKATRRILEKEGHLEESDLKTMEDQGITKEKVLEIVGIVGLKIMTNWTNHIMGTEIDEQFKG